MSYTPAADVESRLQYGFQIIRECLETKVDIASILLIWQGKEIAEENTRLKQLSQTQRKQVRYQLENIFDLFWNVQKSHWILPLIS